VVWILCRRLYAGSGVVDIDEAKMPATTEVGIVSRKFLSPCENHPDEFTIHPHPLLFVEANKARRGGVNGVIPAHLYLRKETRRVTGNRN